MTILLILLGIFFGIILFFCRNIRQSVMNRLATAGYYVAGAWNHLTNEAEETDWTVVRTILWIVLAALILPLILSLFFVVLLSIGITILGLATGSTWVSIPFGIAFVIWFIFFQIPRPLNRLPLYGRLIRLTRWVAGITALVCFILIAMGIIMPNTKIALIRTAWNQEQQTANNLNERSAHSEPEAGIIRKIKEDIYAVPDVPGKEPFFIKAGTPVKILDWDGKKANGKREGLVKITTRNKFGHFDGEDEGWVPTRVVSFTQTAPDQSASASENKKKGDVVFDQVISFNKWDNTDYGYLCIIYLEPGWQYQIRAEGQHFPFIDYRSDRPMGPKGWNADTPSQDHLPLKNEWLGAFIGRIDKDNDFAIEEGCDLPQVSQMSQLQVSLNLSQNWGEKGHPDLNFKNNKGGMRIIIERHPIPRSI